MEAKTLLLVIAAIAVIVLVVMLVIQKNKVSAALDSINKDKKALDEREKILQKEAKIKALEELQGDRDALNEEERERRQEFARQEQKLAKREDTLESKIQEYTDKEQEVLKKKDELLEKEDYLAELVQKQTEELERISGMSTDEAKKTLLEQLKNNLAQEQMQLIKENEAQIREKSLEKAQDILSTAMQRCMIEQVVETTVSVVALPNDEMKGRIIGREGRNIRALETLTGVDLIIDDTPEAVVLSSFDPVRREIAKLALEKLIVDGRIHPVRIEEMVAKAKEEIDKKIWNEGENAALEMGVVGLHKELIKTLGRLYFRTSYGQNVLKHSLEVGHIAGMLAAELGANEKVAKRAGLLHDIGKAVDQTQEGTHIQLGVELATRYGEKPEVIHAIEAHHDDVVANTIEAVLVKVADAISAGRPGARRDTLEIYIKRLQKIEEIVNSYEGIKQSFAVQAGREVRIIVQADMFDDLASGKLARDVAKRIEDELDYPGQIRVTVVREFRATEIAK
ncbi:MAG TPA: ribonuclease Y [Cyanobacteria bacterium UBA11991]|nr:ribonuclease Y [Cyanobacteriota bacterium]MDY6358978.1 ribonuclease Y [Cyanobacteriota bacterium]MDY6382733.1 ribonuclease Y [Cyanobacteriota bacterium]HCB11696.1 ribonuclease Y [Cyanobacteria bacterium UBA11991]